MLAELFASTTLLFSFSSFFLNFPGVTSSGTTGSSLLTIPILFSLVSLNLASSSILSLASSSICGPRVPLILATSLPRATSLSLVTAVSSFLTVPAFSGFALFFLTLCESSRSTFSAVSSLSFPSSFITESSFRSPSRVYIWNAAGAFSGHGGLFWHPVWHPLPFFPSSTVWHIPHFGFMPSSLHTFLLQDLQCRQYPPLTPSPKVSGVPSLFQPGLFAPSSLINSCRNISFSPPVRVLLLSSLTSPLLFFSSSSVGCEFSPKNETFSQSVAPAL